jgi:hypothetical protein
MQLFHLDIQQLIAAAGGDPWAIDKSLQSGRPIQISDLARAFHNAGRCTAESSKAFDEACSRFESSWNRENGDHPINDAAEVQRATRSLGVQAAQLPKIGVDLENIAAALAEAQHTSSLLISTLESQLEEIDMEIGHALDEEARGHHTPAEAAEIDRHITGLINQAVTDTKSALGQLQSLRSGYTDYLQTSLTTLRAQDGYDPAPIRGLDDDGEPTRDGQDQNAVNSYDANQRAKDQALVDNPGSMTPEKADAAARLRDYATATNPAADIDTRRLASERLDDFNMARFSGPLPTNPILGGDARSRAQMRLEWQKKLEQGFSGAPPMSPDQVTQLLDNSEQQAQAVVTRQAMKALEQEGLSPASATKVVSQMSQGTALSGIAKYDATLVGLSGAGLEASAGSVSTGVHNLPDSIGVLSPTEAEALERVGRRLGVAGSLADLALAGIEVSDGAPAGKTMGQAVGGVAGGLGGGWAAGAVGGMWFGPGGALVGGLIGAAVGGWGAGKAGEAVGSQFDR